MKPKLARTLWIPCAAATLAASQAAAQADPDVMAATRRELIQEAQQARGSRDHLRALELANRAGQLGMNTSLRRFIAEEQSALGLVGAALDSAERCVREAPRDAAPASTEHAAACEALAAELRPRAERAVEEEPPPVAPPPRRRVAPAPQALPPAVELRGSLNPGPVALMGLGAGGFIAAGAFYLLRGSALNARDSLCDESGCPEEARPDHDRAVTYNTLTNVSLGVGAACAVGGLVWYLVAPRRTVAEGLRERSAPAPRAGLLLAPSAGGALIGWEGPL